MSLGLITYNAPHLKTEQVYLGLRDKVNVRLYGLPFDARKPRDVLFQHRPPMSPAAHPQDLAQAHGATFIPVESDEQIDDACGLYLVLAGKILSAACIEGKTILNTHPGILPTVRGLDAFKWAILEDKPLGITTHIIDADVDAGRILRQVLTPVYPQDTLERLAARHYELEIAETIRAADWPEASVFPMPIWGKPHRRMGLSDETKMIEGFRTWRARHCWE